MKALISIFTALLYVQLAIAQFNVLEPSDVPNWNKIRQEIAKDLKIVNMRNLTWNPELARSASHFSNDCDEWGHGANFRTAPFGGFTSKFFDKKFMKLMEDISDTMGILNATNLPEAKRTFGSRFDEVLSDPSVFLYQLELYHPLQTAIGCANVSCTKVIGQEQYSYSGVCLLGPKATVKASDIRLEGEPEPFEEKPTTRRAQEVPTARPTIASKDEEESSSAASFPLIIISVICILIIQ